MLEKFLKNDLLTSGANPCDTYTRKKPTHFYIFVFQLIVYFFINV